MSTKSTPVQVQKDIFRSFDKALLIDRLNTLYTLYGVEGVASFINDWLSTLNDSNIYHMELIMDSRDAKQMEEHYAFHKPGSDTECPWCEHEYQEKLDQEK